MGRMLSISPVPGGVLATLAGGIFVIGGEEIGAAASRANLSYFF